MKKILLLSLFLLSQGVSIAADSSEEGISTSPLKIYSGGITVGAAVALNEDFKEVSKRFLQLSFSNTFSVQEYIDIFLDVNWFIPGTNAGADLGCDFIFSRTDFRPLAGIGFGAHYVDHGKEFDENFGPSITAHFGFIYELNDVLALRMRIPYRLVINETQDHSIGIDYSFLFSSRFKKVRKINYN
jgi:hypothetical protein